MFAAVAIATLVLRALSVALFFQLASAVVILGEKEKHVDINANVVRSCGGRWKYPTTCELDCDYVASWVYEPETDAVKFLIQTRRIDKWTGIGFSYDRRMPNSDIIYAMARPDGTVSVFDSHVGDAHAAPQIDAHQDITDAIGFVENDLLTVTFTRPRAAHHSQDVSFLDQNHCPYLLFPVYGGNFSLDNNSIQKHEQTPYVSTARICVVPCDTTTTLAQSTVVTTTTPSGFFAADSEQQQQTLVSGPATVTALPSTQTTTTLLNEMLDSVTVTPSPSTSTEAATLAPQQYIGMPPIEGTRCRARFRFPENCNGIECLYVVDWEYLPVSDRIAFLLRSADTARWTGVGFSQHRRQYVPTNDTDSQGSIDMIVAWVDATTGGRVTITDRHVQNGSIIPERDAVQNIGNLGGKFDGPFQLIAFSRPRNKSSTVNGVNFDNQTCAHFVFPIMGGSYSHSGAIDDDSRGVGAPERTPYITERKICVGPCGIAGVEDSPYVPIPINLPLVSSTPTTLVIIAPATSVTPETTSAATTTTSTEFTTSTSTGASTTNVAGSTTTLESSTPDTSTSSTAYISTIPTSSLSPTGFSYDNVVSSSPTTTEIVENLSSSSTAAASSKLSGTLLRNDCAGVFAYPDDCQADECQYQVEWQYDDETQTIRFLINYDDPKTWFGVGFSQERRKGLPTSAIYAYVEPDDPNRVRIMSAHHFNDMPAVRNSRQFLLLEDGGVRNGRVFAQFVRPLTTPNPQDYQWTATGPCPYFYFPIRGGAFDANTGALAPTTTPYLVSGERMCMRPCAPGTFAPNVTTTTVAMTTTSLPTSTTARSGVTIIISDIGSNVTNTNTTTTTLTPSSSSTTSPLTSTEMSMSTTTPAPIIISSSTPETPTTSTNTNTSHLAGAPSTEVDIIASMTTTSTTSTTEQPPPGRPSCVGLFKYPYTCNGADCMYYAQWENVENAPQVRITLLTSAPENWTAIGFSDTRYMPGTDMIYGWVDDSGQLELYDAFATAHQPPQVDLQRNIVRAAGRRQNGLTQITFVRNFVTNDPEHDYQITRTHCPYLVFPVVSGRYDEETKQISKHGATPLVSTERVCLASCYEGPGAEIESSTTSTTEATPTGEPAVVVPAQHRRRPVPNPQHMKPPSTGEETIVIEKLHPVQTTTVIPEPAVVTPSTTPSMMKVMQSHGYTRDCEGEWRYPPRCSDDDCLYVAMWQYIDSTDSINFTIRAATPSAAALARNTWTGIGFGDTKLMPDTEVILGWVHADDGRVVISDRHTELHNGVPLDTDGQSFTEASGRRETSSITGRNFTTLTFMRPRTTDDKLGEDYQFGDYQCPYLKFPVYGGTYEETPGMLGVVRGHPTDRPPLVSADRVCIRSCRQDYPRSLGLRVRLLDELWNDELRNPHSEAYARMKQKILLQMRQIIGDGRRGVADIRLRGLERGSVVALMDILFEPTMQEPTASGVPAAAQSTAAAPYTLDVVEEVKRALHSEMERTDGRLGTLRVDPNAVVIEPVRDVFAVKPAPIQPGTHQQTLSSSTEQPPSDVIIIPNNATNVAAGGANGGGPSSSFLALVIVLPIIGFILLLILLAALYKFYRVYRHRKLRQTHRVTQEQAKAAGWVDYSAVGGNIMSTHHQHHQHNIVGGTNGAHRNAGFDETLTYPPGQSKPPSYRAHPPAASDFIGGPHKNNGAGGVMMMEQHTAGYHLNGNNNNNIIAGGGGEMQQLSKEQRSTTTTATSSGAATPASAAAAQNQKSAVATTVTTNTTSSSVTSNKPLPNAYTTTPPSAYVHTTSSSGSTLADNAGGGGSNLGGGGGGTTQSGGGSGSGNPQDRNVTEFYFVPSQRRW